MSEQKTDPISADLGAGSMDARPTTSASLGPAPQELAPKEPSPRAVGALGLRLLSVNIASPKLVPEPVGSAEAAKEAFMEAPKVEAAKQASKIETPKIDAAQQAFKVDAVQQAFKVDAAHQAFKVDAAKQAFKVDTAKQAPKVDAVQQDPKVDPAKQPPKVDASPTAAPHLARESLITSLSGDGIYDESWSGDSNEDDSNETVSEADMQTSGRRRLVAFAAVIALAVVSGAIGGALATTGFGRNIGHSSAGSETATASVQNQAVEESIARIDSELAALKELAAAQSAKVNERIDKVEKIQSEPTSKLAKLSEAMDKLPGPAAPVTAPVVAAVAAPKPTTAPRDITGAIRPPAAVPKPEVARLPTLDGWVLRDVADGGALIEGRRGMFEVFAGDTIPGVGRVDAIRRQDGSWVVVTGKGLIVAR